MTDLSLGWTVVTGKEPPARGNADNKSWEGSGIKLYERVKELGYETFLPRERKVGFRHGKRIEKFRALFPGYLFVYVWSNWRSLLEVKGVDGFLMSYADNPEDNRPLIVPQDIITDVRSRLDGNDVLIPVEQERFKLGQRVTPKSGALEGRVGQYICTQSGKEIVWMQNLRVQFAIGDLLPVE